MPHSYMSPLHDGTQSEVGSFASSTTTLVWVESKNELPVQLHVSRADDMQVVSSGFSGANGNLLPLQAHTVAKYDAAYVSQLDMVVVAMEFVLKFVYPVEHPFVLGPQLTRNRLESPCLPHLRQADDRPAAASPTAKTSPHGHVHTTSAALLCCSPLPSPLSSSKSSAGYSPALSSASSTWSVPKATLDRLLDIADELPFDQSSELTPVQMWHCVAQSPNFSKLQVIDLNHLSDKLLGLVKCYG